MNHGQQGVLRPGLQVGGLVFAGLATSFGAIWLLGHVTIFDGGIPQPHMVSDYVHGWIWALGLGALICVLPVAERGQLLMLWLAKIAVDLGVMLLYEWHYGVEGLDSMYYFGWAAWGQHGSLLPVLGNGTKTILRFSALLTFLTGRNYHAMKMVYSFIGLWGCFCFYRAACHYLRSREPWLLYIVGFTPSVLFWSSILGKDPVIFFGAGLYTLGAVGWLRTSQMKYSMPLLCGVVIAIFVREWYGIIMVTPLLLVVGPRLRHPIQKVVSVVAGVAGMIYAFVLFQHDFLTDGLSNVVPEVNAKVGGLATGGSGQNFHGFHSFGSMILYWPWGVFTVIFRPLPWDIHNIFTAMSALSGTILLVLVYRAVRHGNFKSLRDPVLTWALAYLACWASVYGFVGFGNLGMVVRERLEILPIIVMLALLFGTKRGRWYRSRNSGQAPQDSLS